MRISSPNALFMVAAVTVVAGCQANPVTNPAAAPAAPATAPQPIVIDFYADLVCPWCYIGTERLERAIAASGHADRVLVKHHAFLLSPDTPPAGINVADMLRERYGRAPEELFKPAEAAARMSGIPLDLQKQPMNYPTAPAHALLRHAESKGTQRPLKQELFRAHFVDAENISDLAVLTRIATKHGFTADEVKRIITDSNELATVRAEAEAAPRRGVRGVPYFVFNGGQTISGAQSEAALVAAIQQAAR